MRYSAWLATALVLTMLPAGAAAQESEEERLERERVTARLGEARAAMRRGDATAALAIYQDLRDGLANGAADFSCEHADALVRASSSEVLGVRLEAADALFAECFTVAPDDAARAARATRAGIALSAMRTTGASEADRREAAWLTAVWLGAGIDPASAAALHAAGIDPDAVRAALATVPADVRDAHARMLAASSTAQAAGEQPTLPALAAAIARATHARDPDRRAGCHEEWFDLDDSGTIVCTWSVLPDRDWGNTYPSERHVVERLASGAYRGAATMPDADGYDCGSGILYEVTGFERLSTARHGIDGWLLTIEQGYEDYSASDGDDAGTQRDVETTATLCDRASGACVDARVARESCFVPERGRRRCTEVWAARVTVRGGQVTLARRRGRIPDGVPLAVGLSGGTTVARSRAGALPPPPEGASCRLETLDPRPPLNVRADASQTSAVVGTLANGTPIRPLEHRRGWLRIAAPVAGWVWSRNVRRVCE